MPRSVAEATDWLIAAAARGPLPGYRYVGSLERNLLLPTAIGALKPSALVPETFAAGDARQLGRVAVVGTPLLRDFHAGLCAENLRSAGIEATAVAVELDLDRADASTLGTGAAPGRSALGAPPSARGWPRWSEPPTRSRCRRCSACAIPHAVLARARDAARPPCLRDPDAAAVGPRHAPVRDPAARAEHGGRPARARRGRRRPPARGRSRRVGADRHGRLEHEL